MRLKERYPELFEKAKDYEYANMKNGNAFFWNGDEPLEELEKPERIEEIKRNWEESRTRNVKRLSNLVNILSWAHPPGESLLLPCRLNSDAFMQHKEVFMCRK